jgi:hypothetical protein
MLKYVHKHGVHVIALPRIPNWSSLKCWRDSAECRRLPATLQIRHIILRYYQWKWSYPMICFEK